MRTMRTVSLHVIEFGAKHVTNVETGGRSMQRLMSKEGSQNMFVDHLIQSRISQCPKTAEKRNCCTGRMDGRTDGWTDSPSFIDAFLTDASEKECKCHKSQTFDHFICDEM